VPKLKTKRGARKRLRVTPSGKIKRKKSFLRHILSHKAKGRKRQLRKAAYVHPSNVKQMKQLMPYG